MKLLFFIDELGSGGAQRQMVNLALEFKDLEHSITFLTYRKSDFYEKVLREKGIEIINIPEEGGYLNRILTCRKIIRKGMYDSVLAFLEGPCFIAEVASFPFRKWKLVIGERSANPAMLTSIKQKLYRILHFRADYVIANSHCNIDMVQAINPFLKEDKCRVIYNIYDIEKFIVNENYEYLRDGFCRVVIASNLRYWKNLQGLIEAVYLLSEEEKKRLRIDWYGHEFDNDQSKKDGLLRIKELGLESIFTFYPPTKDIFDKMKDCEAVGLFSHFEGLSNTICEGMALGKPIITTRVSDNSLFIENGVNGFLCDSKNYIDMSIALSNLLKCSKEELIKIGSTNRKSFEKTFDKDSIVNSYIELLK